MDSKDFQTEVIVFEKSSTSQSIKDNLMKKVKKNTETDIILAENAYIAPWMSLTTKTIKIPSIRLHNEIVDFYNYISPTSTEHERRLNALEELKTTILKKFNNIDIYAFGSFMTKFYLPDADIDIVIINENRNIKRFIEEIAIFLMNETEKFSNIVVIRNAKVPLVKLRDKKNGLNFDISFNKMDGIKQLKEIEKANKYYPELKYLLMIFKIFLRQRELHETYTGGVGSFLLFCLILAFLREFRRNYIDNNRKQELQNIYLSEYLIKFLEFYGIQFNSNTDRIVMNDGGGIFKKDDDDPNFSLISPQDQSHDLGSAAFRIKDIFSAFKNRYNFLINYNFKEDESILKYLINPSNNVFSHIKKENII